MERVHRDHMIVAKFLAGRTCSNIGEWAGISKQRVHQILKRQGMSVARREEIRKNSTQRVR